MESSDLELNAQIARYTIGERTKSAAMLAWFLEEIWGLDPEEVPDAICDKKGDKGIDAILVDDDSLEITLLQAKHFESPNRKQQGDNDFRNFIGASKWFNGPDSVDRLLRATANRELKSLISRSGVREKLGGSDYSVNLVFVTNGDLNKDAAEYTEMYQQIDRETGLDVWPRTRLAEALPHVTKPLLQSETISLPTSGGVIHTAIGSNGDEMAIGLVSAKELVNLPGISDRSIFSQNVRLYRGATKVNKGLLDESLRKSDEHPYFQAYHNGLTLITDSLSVGDGQKLNLKGVGVVNGCQSLVTMFDNRDSITSKMRLVVKVVQVGKNSDRVDKITYRSNSQNAVTMRDQRSTDVTMRSLQSRIQEAFPGEFAMRVKEGETVAASDVIDNTLVAQLVMACFREEPWAAVRKVRLFEDDYRTLFNIRLTPERVYLLHLIDEAIRAHQDDLAASLRPSFAAVRFTLAYLLTCVLRATEEGMDLLQEPAEHLADKSVLSAALDSIATEVVLTLNDFIEEQEADDESFDAKTAFKSRAGVVKLRHDLERVARRANRRGNGFYFKTISN